MKKIIAVDDDNLITMTLETLLPAMLDCEVISFNNPEEALASPELLNGQADMIISDFLMPQMNGLQFFKKAKEICPSAVRILLTGYADKENAIECINTVGLYYYVEKPWDNTTLLNIIENGLEKIDMMEEIRKKNEELENWNKILEQKVNNRVAAVRNLLNNSNQGFLTIEHDFRVSDEYSVECLEIFGEKIEGKIFSKLIYPQIEIEQKLVEDILIQVFNTEDEFKREVYLSLMPRSIELHDKVIDIDYKMVINPENEEEQIIMAILTDVTETCKLKNQVEEERQRLKMIVGAVTDAAEFIDLIEDYKKFCTTEIKYLLNSGKEVDTILTDIFMSVHTFKGIFGQKEMHNAYSKLHDFEGFLHKCMNITDKDRIAEVKSYLQSNYIDQWVDEDLSSISCVLGEDFLMKEQYLEVKKTDVDELKAKAILLPKSLQKDIVLNLIQKLKYIPFAKMVSGYPKYTFKLAEKLEKLMNPFSVCGGNIMVDGNLFAGLARSLVHIFRNVVDYGIEKPEYRVTNGKEECGNVKFNIWEESNFLNISIEDDGAGIDISKLRAKAIEKNLFSEDELSKMTDEDVYRLIFKNGVSSKDDLSELSGRGMGLAAVWEEVEKINGTIGVVSREGEGTIFSIRVPLEIKNTENYVELEEITRRLTIAAKSYLTNIILSEPANEIERTVINEELFNMGRYTVLLQLRGEPSGVVLLSFDDSLATNVCSALLMQEIDNYDINLISNAVAEAGNMIVGEFANAISEYGQDDVFTVPTAFISEKMQAILPRELIVECVKFKEGNVKIAFIAN